LLLLVSSTVGYSCLLSPSSPVSISCLLSLLISYSHELSTFLRFYPALRLLRFNPIALLYPSASIPVVYRPKDSIVAIQEKTDPLKQCKTARKLSQAVAIAPSPLHRVCCNTGGSKYYPAFDCKSGLAPCEQFPGNIARSTCL